MTRARRTTITLIWALVQLIVCAALFFGCGIAVAAVTWIVLPFLFHTQPSASGVLIGFGVGIVAAVWICHSARMWLLRLRLRRLRRHGTEATASVAELASTYQSNPRGPGTTTYAVHLRWRDADGSIRNGERRYRFWGAGTPAFERACATRNQLIVRYDPRHPSGFVVDIPFAPTMADLIR
jgi:uncharacterized protein DUF3592